MITIAIAQMIVRPGQPRKNRNAIFHLIDEAKEKGAQLLILPELCLSGTFLGNTWHDSAFVEDCLQFGEEIASYAGELSLIFGNIAIKENMITHGKNRTLYKAVWASKQGKLFPPKGEDTLYQIANPSPVFNGDPFLKVLLEEDISYIDPVTSKAWEFTFGKETLSVAPYFNTSLPSANLYVKCAATPYFLGKARSPIAKDTPLPSFLLYANAVGIQNKGKNFYVMEGLSGFYSPLGEEIYTAPSYEEALLIKKWDVQNPSLASSENSIPSPSSQSEAAMVYRHLHYGLRYILAMLHIKKVVIGVSGGIDSSLTAALYGTVVPPEDLYLVNMPSQYTSSVTKSIASRLAANLGCHYATCPIEEELKNTTEELKNLVFSGKVGTSLLTVTEFMQENMQARDRSSRILSAISASVGGVFTCNGNKTELTIGYATMYGDLAGFLSASGDLWKHQVYALSRYLNEEVYKREVIPEDSLTIIPSAELSPAQDITKGLGDPLQYDYHDRLFRSFVEGVGLSGLDAIAEAYADGTLAKKLDLPKPIEHYFPDGERFFQDLERWWNLYNGLSVAKRIQSPPLIVISARPFGSFEETQKRPYYSTRYEEIKNRVLSELN